MKLLVDLVLLIINHDHAHFNNLHNNIGGGGAGGTGNDANLNIQGVSGGVSIVSGPGYSNSNFYRWRRRSRL